MLEPPEIKERPMIKKPRKTGKPRMDICAFRMPHDVYQRLKDRAEQHGRTTSNFVRLLIRKELGEVEKEVV